MQAFAEYAAISLSSADKIDVEVISTSSLLCSIKLHRRLEGGGFIYRLQYALSVLGGPLCSHGLLKALHYISI